MNSSNECGKSIYFLHQPDTLQKLPVNRLIDCFKDQGQFLSPDNRVDGLRCYEQDSQSLQVMPPLAVFRPDHISSIAPFVRACGELDLPITARCGGSGLVGGAVPGRGGIILLTGHFQSIIDYDKDSGLVSAEPGATPRQIKRTVSKDGWDIPLEMASEGISGLAGCLCSQAKGYHQGLYSLTQNIESVTFIDGCGNERNAPGSLLCGSEGMLGIIIRLDLRLTRKAEERRVIYYNASPAPRIEDLLDLTKIAAVKSLIKGPNPGEFTVVLEGDSWRVEGGSQYIENVWGPYSILASDRIPSIAFPVRQSFYLLSEIVPMKELSYVLDSLGPLCEKYQMCFQTRINLLDGTVHTLLSSPVQKYFFYRNLERWLTERVHILENAGGSIAGRHGLGTVLHRFMPPFSREEDLIYLRRFLLKYDPKRLFSRDRFFPSPGQSLEKIYRYAE